MASWQIKIHQPVRASGHKAQLLYQLGQFEEAEAALQKAFELNPRYPFGHYLQARFRYEEREIAGALILFRRSAEYYDPESKLLLSDIYGMIFDCEMKLNHPVAARAALELAARFNPANDSLRQAWAGCSAARRGFPEAAKVEYEVSDPAGVGFPGSAPPPEESPGTTATGKLTDAVAAFQELVQQEPRKPRPGTTSG